MVSPLRYLLTNEDIFWRKRQVQGIVAHRRSELSTITHRKQCHMAPGLSLSKSDCLRTQFHRAVTSSIRRLSRVYCDCVRCFLILLNSNGKTADSNARGLHMVGGALGDGGLQQRPAARVRVTPHSTPLRSLPALHVPATCVT
jgi:hypothetical protein